MANTSSAFELANSDLENLSFDLVARNNEIRLLIFERLEFNKT